MRYYCQSCTTKVIDSWGIKPFYDVRCPRCSQNMMPYQDYETPNQYEIRTGKPYPDNGAVWMRFKEGKDVMWAVYHYGSVKDSDNLLVIAEPSVPPPKDWRP